MSLSSNAGESGDRCPAVMVDIKPMYVLTERLTVHALDTGVTCVGLPPAFQSLSDSSLFI